MQAASPPGTSRSYSLCQSCELCPGLPWQPASTASSCFWWSKSAIPSARCTLEQVGKFQVKQPWQSMASGDHGIRQIRPLMQGIKETPHHGRRSTF